MPYVRAEEYARLQAADDACWTLILAICLGLVELEDLEARQFIACGGLQDWANRCERMGLMRTAEEENNGESGELPEGRGLPPGTPREP